MEKFLFDIFKKIELYKIKNKKTYTEIAKEIQMTPHSFANLRLDLKTGRSIPRKSTLDKLKKII